MRAILWNRSIMARGLWLDKFKGESYDKQTLNSFESKIMHIRFYKPRFLNVKIRFYGKWLLVATGE